MTRRSDRGQARLFVSVFAIGAALLWAAGSAFDWSERYEPPLLLVTAGATAAVGYLIHAGRG